VVRDVHGKAVAGLTKDDFRVLDDGKERLIDHFVVENTLQETLIDHNFASTPEALKANPAHEPRFLALFFDDVNSNDAALAGGLKRTQAAAGKFVKGALKGEVRIAISTASGTQSVEFTDDEARLTEAISALRAHVKMREEGLTPCPRITPYLAYRIAFEHDPSSMQAVMFDDNEKGCPTPRAVIVAQAEETWRKTRELSTDTLNTIGRVVVHLGTMPGKRELLLASSGFLAMSEQGLKDQIIDRAIRAGVVINALDAKGIYAEAPAGMRPEDAGFTQTVSGMTPAINQWVTFQATETPLRLQVLNEPMGTLTEGTGGVFYHNNNDLNAGFRKLGSPPEVIYRLSFRPEGVTPDGAFHTLKVNLHGKANYEVQARPGYFAPNPRAAESVQAKIDREMAAEDTVTEFPAVIQIQRDKAGLLVVVKFDISKLLFVNKGDRQTQRIVFTAGLIDAQGKLAAAKEIQMDLELAEATYKRLVAGGLSTRTVLEVPPGIYKLRQVSEEAVEGKMACSMHVIEVKWRSYHALCQEDWASPRVATRHAWGRAPHRVFTISPVCPVVDSVRMLTHGGSAGRKTVSCRETAPCGHGSEGGGCAFSASDIPSPGAEAVRSQVAGSG
jgi:VWFA-related protein